MRGQPGPCLALGNYPAARRYVRGRKPPPIILWAIGIITCLLFIGAAAMLTVGYLNPFGTVGLAILGVGAVVYFGAILFLVLSCLWVERKYPGMPPLSFRIYSRKPNRMPPTTFTNPNISGQVPVATTQSYSMDNELPIQIPGFKDVGGKTDKSREKKDNSPSDGSLAHAQNPKGQSTVLDILQEDDHNGGINEEVSPNIKHHSQTNNDNLNTNEDTQAAGMEDKSQSKQEQPTSKHGESSTETHAMDQNKSAQHNQHENDNNISASPKRKRVKLKTHHIEVPFEDYPSSDSSTSLSNKKENSQDIQDPNPKNNSQYVNTSTENENSPTTGASKSALPKTPSAMDKQKEASSSVNSLSYARDDHHHQRSKTEEHSSVTDIKQESSKPTSTHKSIFTEKADTPLPSSSQPTKASPTHGSKKKPGKHQNNQESSQGVRGLTPTNSASPPAARNTTEHESIASKPTNSIQKDSALILKSSVSAKKLLDFQKNNVINPARTQESVQENSQTSSLLNIGENKSPHKNNLTHNNQNTTSVKHHLPNPKSLGDSPTRAQKMQSPERKQISRQENAVLTSHPKSRKTEHSSPQPMHHQERLDLLKAQRTQEQSITIQTFSSSNRKEEIQKKEILHSSPSSQSSDLKSTSSSIPPRQRQGSPNKSPRVPRDGDPTSKTTDFHSRSRNEEFSNRQSRHSSPSSQSSDVPSSPSSSPHRTRPKSPDLSTKMQRHKDIPVTSVSISSNKKEELQKKLSLPSSQSSGASSSPTSSPISAKQLLQYKKGQANPNNQNKSVPVQRTSK